MKGRVFSLDISRVSGVGGCPHARFPDRGEDYVFIQRLRHLSTAGFRTVVKNIFFHSWPKVFCIIALGTVIRNVSVVCMVPLSGFFLLLDESGEKCIILSCAERVSLIPRRTVFLKYSRVLSIDVPWFLEIEITDTKKNTNFSICQFVDLSYTKITVLVYFFSRLLLLMTGWTCFRLVRCSLHALWVQRQADFWITLMDFD